MVMAVKSRFLISIFKKRVLLVFLVAITVIFVFISMQIYITKYKVRFRWWRSIKTTMKPSPLSHDNTSCAVILRESDGRLGNRLFMFASAYGIARMHGCRLYIDEWIIDELSLLFEFDLTSTITLQEINQLKNINSKYSECAFFPEFLRYNSIKYLELKGFWQAYGHFIKYEHELKVYLQINKNVITKIANFFPVKPNPTQGIRKFKTDNSKLLTILWTKTQPSDFAILNNTTVEQNHHEMRKRIQNSNVTWIGVHIRRKDFIKIFKAESSITYITDAMNYYENKFKNVFFAMVSDDKKYCKKHFANKENVIITPKSYSYREDFAILSFCQHSIITAGSFGWWAAFLAGGDVIHDVHFRFERCVNCSCSEEFYYPPWFLFPPKAS